MNSNFLLKLKKKFKVKNNKKYKVKAIVDSVVYNHKANNQISNLYYLIL